MARLKKGPFVVLGAIIAVAVTNCRMNGVADETANVFAQAGNVRFEAAEASFDGELIYENVSVWPEATSETTEAVRAERLVIDTPGFGWLLGAAYGNNRIDTRNRGFALPDELAGNRGRGAFSGPPRLERFKFRAENVRLDRDATAFFMPSWLGFDSLAPFDALGCALNKTWRAEDISGVLNLPEGAVQLSVEVSNPKGNLAEITATFDRSGVSKAIFQARYEMSDGFQLRALDFDDAKLKQASWTIEDQGFVKARNSACATLVGLSEKRYINLHLTALKRELLAAGLIPDQALEDSYRHYLEKGGKLVFAMQPSGDYKNALASAADVQARAAALGVTVQTTGAAVTPSFFAITPSEWNEDIRARTMTNLINQGKALAEGSLVLPDESTASLLENLLLTESSTAVVDASALPFSTMADDPAADPAAATATDAAADTDEAESEILIQEIAFDELPKAIGRKVVITTRFGSKREGVLKAAHNAGVTVYTDLRGMMADVNIPRAEIAKAEVHWESLETQ